MIALTRGQLRRRWIISLLTLITAIPSPIVLMGILTKGGKLVIKSGKIATGTCAACCGGGSCSGCVSAAPCANCSGDTPSQRTLTITGFSNAMPCTACSGFQSATHGTGTINGTYTVPQNLGADKCFWLLNTGTISFVTTQPDCVSSPFTVTAAFDISLRQTATTFTIAVTSGSGAFNWFTRVFIVTDCCASYSGANQNAAYACSGGTGVFGITGSVVSTPC